MREGGHFPLFIETINRSLCMQNALKFEVLNEGAQRQVIHQDSSLLLALNEGTVHRHIVEITHSDLKHAIIMKNISWSVCTKSTGAWCRDDKLGVEFDWLYIVQL